MGNHPCVCPFLHLVEPPIHGLHLLGTSTRPTYLNQAQRWSPTDHHFLWDAIRPQFPGSARQANWCWTPCNLNILDNQTCRCRFVPKAATPTRGHQRFDISTKPFWLSLPQNLMGSGLHFLWDAIRWQFLETLWQESLSLKLYSHCRTGTRSLSSAQRLWPPIRGRHPWGTSTKLLCLIQRRYSRPSSSYSLSDAIRPRSWGSARPENW